MGILEILIIVLVAIVLFAPRKLPGLAGSLGHVVRDFKQGLHGGTDGDSQDTRKDR